MIINEGQLQFFNNKEIDIFIELSLEFVEKNLPEHFSRIPKSELELFIRETLDFANQYRVFMGINIQKLLYLRLSFEDQWFTNGDLLTLLKCDRAEDLRIDDLWIMVESGLYKKKFQAGNLESL